MIFVHTKSITVEAVNNLVAEKDVGKYTTSN